MADEADKPPGVIPVTQGPAIIDNGFDLGKTATVAPVVKFPVLTVDDENSGVLQRQPIERVAATYPGAEKPAKLGNFDLGDGNSTVQLGKKVTFTFIR